MRTDDFFYEGAERGALLDALDGYAHEGATTALEGETGSGVTTLLGMLCMSLVGEFELIRMDGAEALDANAVVDAMLVHFDVERPSLADALRQGLADSRLIVVVDNAGEIPEAALATMVSLKQKLGARLVYVFGGHPGVTDRLRDAGLAVADTLELPALEADQVVEFADLALAMDIDDDEAQALCMKSGGQPGPLRHLLNEQKPKQPASARRPLPRRHGLAVGALLLVVIVLWLASGGEEAPDENVVTIKVPAPPEAMQQEEVPSGEERLEQRFAGPAGLVTSPEQARAALLEYNPTADALESAESEQTGNDDGIAAGTETSTETSSDASSETNSETNSGAASDQGDDTEVATASATDPGPHDTTALTPDSAEPGATAYHREDWLASRSSGEWFLQVIVTSHEKSARRILDLINRNGAYYQAKRGGKPVFLVLAGPYPSRDAAVKAGEALPEDLRAAGPFPRAMPDIKAELQ